MDVRAHGIVLADPNGSHATHMDDLRRVSSSR